MQQHEGSCHGSGRSIDGFSLHGALARLSAMLDRFGGHDMAAGLGLRAERLDEFAAAFIDHASQTIAPELLTPQLDIDCDAHLRELSNDAVRTLEKIGPFGRGNPEVRVVLRGMRVTMPPRTMGAFSKHLSVQLSAPSDAGGMNGQTVLRVVGWNWGDQAATFAAGRRFDVAIEPRLNSWNGSVNVEGELKDAAPVA